MRPVLASKLFESVTVTVIRPGDSEPELRSQIITRRDQSPSLHGGGPPEWPDTGRGFGCTVPGAWHSGQGTPPGSIRARGLRPSPGTEPGRVRAESVAAGVKASS